MAVPKGHPPAETPVIAIPYRQAVERYGSSVAEIMDKLMSSESTAKSMAAQEFDWFIAWQRGEDPTLARDAKEFLKYNLEGTSVWLLAKTPPKSGHRWKGAVTLDHVPDRVVANLENRAKQIMTERLHRERFRSEQPGEDEPTNGQYLGTAEGEEITKLLRTWMDENKHNESLGRAALYLLRELFSTAE
jgi:hypothetical protein